MALVSEAGKKILENNNVVQENMEKIFGTNEQRSKRVIMSEWTDIKLCGMPEESGCFLIKHESFFPYAAMAYFLVEDGEFLLEHKGALPMSFPTSLPIVATHWIRIPE